MSTDRSDLGLSLAVIELLARVGSIASITLLVLLFMGEALHPAEISSNEWAGLLFFPIGVTIGMIIAWWKEAVGSAVTLLSLLAFYLVYGYFLGNHIGGWAFIAFTFPGFLFLLHWLCATLVNARRTRIRNLECLAKWQSVGRGWHSSAVNRQNAKVRSA